MNCTLPTQIGHIAISTKSLLGREYTSTPRYRSETIHLLPNHRVSCCVVYRVHSLVRFAVGQSIASPARTPLSSRRTGWGHGLSKRSSQPTHVYRGMGGPGTHGACLGSCDSNLRGSGFIARRCRAQYTGSP